MTEKRRLILSTTVVGLVGIAAGLSLANGWLPSQAAQQQYGEKTWADTTVRRVIHAHDGLPEHEHVITIVVTTTEGTPHGDFHNFAATQATGNTRTPAAVVPEQGAAPAQAAAPAQGDNEIMIIGREYMPSILTVPVGTKVTWISKEGEMHTVTSDKFIGTLAPFSSFSHTFTEPGTYEYHCEARDGMAGKVIVK